MTDTFLARVEEALQQIPHGANCQSRAYLEHEYGPCDCDREQRIAQRVTAAIEAAWRFNPYSRNLEGSMAALAASPKERGTT